MKGKERKAKEDPVALISGRRIAALRESRGWTQGDLAKRTGWDEDKTAKEQPNVLSLSRISNFEQGTRRVGLEEAEILSRVFALPAAYFMGAISEQEARVLAAMTSNSSANTTTPPGHRAKFPAEAEHDSKSGGSTYSRVRSRRRGES